MIANNEKTIKKGHKPANGFKKGVSGNPNGRPKQTDAQKDALEKIKALASDASRYIEDWLSNDAVPYSVKIKLIEIILERTYGKAESNVKIDTSVSIEESADRIRRILSGEKDEQR